MCHIVVKYPSNQTKDTLICFDCRKQIHYVRQIDQELRESNGVYYD